MPEAKITISAEDRTRAVLSGVQASLGAVQSKGEALNQSFAKFGSLLGSAFVGLSFTAFVKSTANGIDALNDVRDATGASIEKLSALEDVALTTGHSMDTVADSIVKLNASLAEAIPGNDKEKALKAIGLSAAELRRMDPAEALHTVARAMVSYADDGNRARIIQELFGRSVREVAPLLNDLAEKTKLVGTVTQEQAEQADKFNKQLSALEKHSVDAARAIANVLLPQLNNLFEAYQKFGGLKGIIGALFGQDEVSQASRRAEDLSAAVSRAADTVDRLAEGLRRDPGSELLAGRLDKARARLKDLQAQAAAASQAIKALVGTGGPAAAEFNDRRSFKPESAPFTKGTVPTAPAKQIDASAQALASYVDGLQKEIDKGQELTEQQKALNLLKELGTTGQIPQVRQLVLGLAQKAEQLRDEAEIEKGITEELQRQYQLRKSIDESIEQFAGRSADALKRAQTSRLEQRLAAGEQFTPAELDKIVKGIAGIKDEYKDKIDEMDELTKQFGRNVQDALGQTVKATLKGDFENISQLWGNLLLDMASQAIAMQLGKSLFGDFFKGGSLGGTFGDIAALFGFAKGGAFAGGGQVTAFAHGGVFNQPTPFSYGASKQGVLGEAGPEGVLPLKRGTDGKLGVISSGSGGLVFSPVTTIHVDSRADRGAVLSDVRRVVGENNKQMLAMLHARGVA